MHVVLKKEIEEWVAAEISAGRYRSESELVESALRKFMEATGPRHPVRPHEEVVADDACFERKRRMIRDCYARPPK